LGSGKDAVQRLGALEIGSHGLRKSGAFAKQGEFNTVTMKND
jgi:hypothetical protein